MASMNFGTANPLGRWWHPLPLTSGLGAVIGSVILKSTGFLDELSWGWVIALPIIADIVINALLIGGEALFSWIADRRERKRNNSPTNDPGAT